MMNDDCRMMNCVIRVAMSILSELKFVLLGPMPVKRDYHAAILIFGHDTVKFADLTIKLQPSI